MGPRFLLFLANLRAEIAEGKPSAIALLAVNCFPLLGVLILGWQVFDVVILYWTENVVIGVVNVLKMLTCWPDPVSAEERMQRFKQARSKGQLRDIAELRAVASMTGQTTWQASKLFFVPFFTVHYGGFCAGHGFFICALLGPGGPMGGGDPFETMSTVFGRTGLVLGAVALAASHLFSYFSNYLGRGEFRTTTPPELMFAPYGRIMLLHVAILLGGFLAEFLGSPIWMLVLLIAGKTLLDLTMHLREHKDAPAASPLDLGAMTTVEEPSDQRDTVNRE